MMQKKFGQFSQLEDENPTGSQAKTEMPPIAGSPMPNAGMKNKTMGSVFPAKDDPSAKQFAGRNAAAKRLKGLPNRSPLGPITGGPQKPQARPQQPQQRPGMQQRKQQQPNQDTGTGDQWMGELWQGLTLDEQPQGGFAMGGAVNPMESNPSMDMYNQVTRELESGGVSGYAHGGMVEQSKEIASKGRNGDTMLMHIQPRELQGLQALLGPLTVNPDTGNPEAFDPATMLLIIGGLTAGSAGIGGIIDGGEGAKKGAMIGLGAGAAIATGGAAASALAAPTAAPTVAATAPTAAAGVGPLASGGAQTASQAAAAKAAALMGPNPYLSSLGLTAPAQGAGMLAPGGGVLSIGGGGGVTAAEATSLGVANTAEGTALAGQLGAGFQPAATGGVSKSGLATAAASGLSSLSSQGQQEQQAPMAPPPPTPAPSPLRDVPSPYARLKRRTGINSLPGSRSII
jgi:hypothetical protein